MADGQGGLPPAMPRRPVVGSIAAGLRPLRHRMRQAMEAIDRGRQGAQSDVARELVQIANEGHVGSSPSIVYRTNPVTIDVDDSEGAVPTFLADTSQTIPVVVLNGPPTVGDFLVAYAVGGRWCADGRGSVPCQSCWWLCGPHVIIDEPPGGLGGNCTQAYGVVTVADDGTIASIKVCQGGGCYDDAHPPAVAIVSANGIGSGATATAKVKNGVVTGLTLGNKGSGYVDNTPPAKLIATVSCANWTATITMTKAGDLPVSPTEEGFFCFYEGESTVDIPGSALMDAQPETAVRASLSGPQLSFAVDLRLARDTEDIRQCKINPGGPCSFESPVGVFALVKTDDWSIAANSGPRSGGPNGPIVVAAPCRSRPWSWTTTVVFSGFLGCNFGGEFNWWQAMGGECPGGVDTPMQLTVTVSEAPPGS